MIERYLNWRTLILLVALCIIGGTVLYSRYLAKKIEGEEKERVEEWVAASRLELQSSETDALTLTTLIKHNNTDLPLILTDEKDNILDSQNIDSIAIKADPNFLKNKLETFRKTNTPIVQELTKNPYTANKIFYGNTKLLDEIRYYPIAQLVIVALFLATILALVNTRNRSTQNQVWAGMAKETAHQMGTPLTSLQGWVEMLRENPDNEAMVSEMDKDVSRLKLVSNRFGKIGSKPQLIPTNLAQQIESMQHYMQRRASGRVQIIFNKPSENIVAPISPPLFDWVMENLLKNGLDAMEGKGILTIDISQNNTQIFVDVSDTGKGIAAANIKKVFNPGFTTKKRGWGLGLTLSKRIMEQYHKGSLFVKNSELGKGTSFRVVISK